MEYYAPAEAPDSISWLAMTTEEKLILVMGYYQQHNDVDFMGDSIKVHSSVYVLIENQLAENTQMIPETLATLMQLDMSREAAIGAIGRIALEEMQGGIGFTSEQYHQKFQDLILSQIQAG